MSHYINLICSQRSTILDGRLADLVECFNQHYNAVILSTAMPAQAEGN